jgi:multisubunit Na+/H+ antiporter MnhE subunit
MRLARVVGTWLCWWCGLFGLYLLLAAQVTVEEAVVGAIAAALAATGTTVTGQAGSLNFRARLSWLWRFCRLPIRVVVESGIVGVALWRQIVGRQDVQGTFRLVPFNCGGEDAMSGARRALVTAGVSLAPNTYVVELDRKQGVMIVHQLVPPTEPPGHGDEEWPL